MNLLIALVFLSTMGMLTMANAYELNGSMSHDGGGSYSVNVENENGHEYNGEATDNGDGTLDVQIEDDDGQSYSGVMTKNGDGSYSLDLQNDSSGGSASGAVTLDH